jgi:hypothetical protein
MGRALEELSDIEEIEIDLDLICTPPSGEGSVRLPGGGTIWLSLEEEPDDRESPIRLLFVLDVDIYAPLSWGVERDNRLLAGLNSPRLVAFLRRLNAHLRGALMDIDAPRYRGQNAAGGFAPEET